MRGRLRLGGRAGLVLLAGVSLLFAGTSLSSAAEQTTTGTAAPAALVVKDNDFNGDTHSDVLSVDSAGRLWLYPGNGAAGWLPRIGYSYGWDAMTAILAPGDFDGDGNADLMSVDSTGYLRLYASNGKAGWLYWKRFGGGWNAMTSVFGPGDFNGDGFMDILARQNTGQLWLYPGDGKGGFLARVGYGYGWNAMTSVRGPGDFDGDTFVDVTARDGDGNLWLYRGDGKGGWLPGRTLIGSSWQNLTAIVTPWDFNGDDKVDLLVRNAGGYLYLYRGSGTGGWILPPVLVGSGWNSMTAITA
ncbi:VCBS repeat-containing protein [Kribbella sp. HUAS MG21]|uniref:VCBS repeat-containing protein n=1 Tax=Kribbella sp. HUAS MG21 TaxID=3160966 RepID=A0AAU7T846_9ACTN